MIVKLSRLNLIPGSAQLAKIVPKHCSAQNSRGMIPLGVLVLGLHILG